MNGGKLEFVLSSEPNKAWGSAEGDYPVIGIEDDLICPVPYVVAPSHAFKDEIIVELKTSIQKLKSIIQLMAVLLIKTQ